MAIMDLTTFFKQKGSKPKTYFYEKKQQFRESHLKIVHFWWSSVRRGLQKFLFIPVVPIPERGQTRGRRPAWLSCLWKPRYARNKTNKCCKVGILFGELCNISTNLWSQLMDLEMYILK